MSLPFVSIQGNTPKRFALQCHLCSSTDRRDSKNKAFFDGAQTYGKVYVYISNNNKGGKSNWICSKDSLTLHSHMPKTLWKNCLYEMHFDSEGTLSDSLPIPDRSESLRLGYSLTSPTECTLFLEWQTEPDNCPLVLSHFPASASNAALSQEFGTYYRGQKIFLLSIPRIAFLPFVPGCAPLSQPENSFSNLGGLLGSREWHFRPPQLAFHTTEADTKKDEGFLLALDFGSSSTTIAISDQNDKYKTCLMGDLCPWQHETLIPDLSRMKSDREASWKVERWKGEEPDHEKSRFAVPADMLPNRQPLPRESVPWVPSLLCRIEGVDGQEEIVIGDEALAVLEANRNKPSSSLLHTFVFSPKKSIGAESNTSANKDVEDYLFALFEMVAHRLSTLEGQGRGPHGPLQRLSWSYPVVWLKHQIGTYEECLRKALERSSLKNYIANRNPAGILRQNCSLDEASGAAMGFLARRFNRTPPLEILGLLGPYRVADDAYEEMERNVLVLDFGAGTTDIAWLALKKKNRDGSIAKSNVELYFALDQGGIEITRHIAQILKDRIRQHNQNRGMSDEEIIPWLRTNLNDPGIDEQFVVSTSKHIRSRYRRSKIAAYFDAAERIKKQLGTTPTFSIDWAPLIAETPLEAPANNLLTQEQLRDIVTRVFKPIFDRIAIWARERPKLDLVLVSGRSSALLGLRQLLEESIPPEKAPLKNDFVWPLEYSFEETEDGTELQETAKMEIEAKTVVAEGLLQNVIKSLSFQGNSISCDPMDTMRRSRCIGVLARDNDDKWHPYFRNDMDLLVEADYERIQEDTELPHCIEETNFTSEGKGLFLGINFAGKGNANFESDRPQVYGRILIHNTGMKFYRSMKIFFRQLSATEICFSRAVLTDESGEEKESSAPQQDGNRLTVDGVTLELKLFPGGKDFRNSGKIHLDGEHSIDRDLSPLF